MTSIEVNDRFINVKTGVTVQVLGVDDDTAKVATVTVTGRLINRRTLKVASLKTEARTARGTLRTSGYVAVHALPESHPLAPDLDTMPEPVPAPEPINLFAKVDLESMEDDELFERGRALRAEVALVERKLKDVKGELKRRRPQARSYILGNAFLGITTNVRFDAALAKSTLTPEEYDRICLPKPDAERAREVLDAKRYAEICKDHGNKVEIRTATDEDRLALAEKETADEVDAEIAEFGLRMDDPFMAA